MRFDEKQQLVADDEFIITNALADGQLVLDKRHHHSVVLSAAATVARLVLMAATGSGDDEGVGFGWLARSQRDKEDARCVYTDRPPSTGQSQWQYLSNECTHPHVWSRSCICSSTSCVVSSR